MDEIKTHLDDLVKRNQKKTGLELLRAPFPANQISKLPKPFKKDSPKGKCPECGGFHGLPAAHLDYVGHAALTSRLLDVDENWEWEPLAIDPSGLPLFDKTGGLWIKLTVCGVTRLGYGNAENSTFKEVGSREKEVIGDALRNAAMRFGAALDLWHKGDLHKDEEPAVKSQLKTATPPTKWAKLVSKQPANNVTEPLPLDATEKIDVPRVPFTKDEAGDFIIPVGKIKGTQVKSHPSADLKEMLSFVQGKKDPKLMPFKKALEIHLGVK